GDSVLRPILLSAEADPAAYELNHAQSNTQQREGRAPIRHTSRIRRKTEKDMVTASVLGRKSPCALSWVKPVTAYDADATDIKESRRLHHDCGAKKIERESGNTPETRSSCGKYPWSSHGRQATQGDAREIPGCRRDIRKAQVPIYITPPHNFGGGIEVR